MQLDSFGEIGAFYIYIVDFVGWDKGAETRGSKELGHCGRNTLRKDNKESLKRTRWDLKPQGSCEQVEQRSRTKALNI
jgi:hypothetical protein